MWYTSLDLDSGFWYCIVLFLIFCFVTFPVTLPGTYAWRSAITWGKPAFGVPSLFWVFAFLAIFGLAFGPFFRPLFLAVFEASCAFCCFLLILNSFLAKFLVFPFVGANYCQICIILLI